MPLPSPVEEHIATIARHEQDFLAKRSPAEKLADRVASFAGSMPFVLSHILIFTGWITLNHFTRWRFDPFPYPFFDTLVALEAILLASFILMRQSSLARRADEREHLMLQILLLTEKEVSAVVRMNQEIAEANGLKSISRDKEIAELGRPTPIDQVAGTIQEKLGSEN